MTLARNELAITLKCVAYNARPLGVARLAKRGDLKAKVRPKRAKTRFEGALEPKSRPNSRTTQRDHAK